MNEQGDAFSKVFGNINSLFNGANGSGSNSMNFKAGELSGIVIDVRGWLTHLSESIKYLSDNIAHLANMIHSGDSTLSDQLTQISTLVVSLGNQYNLAAEELLNKLTNYVSSTLTNETTTDTSVSSINEQLNSISNLLDGTK